MATVLVTGSADGLGRFAAQRLVKAGHEVVLHARSMTRGRDAMAGVPGAKAVVVGDLSTLAEMMSVAEQANALGRFDAVIHNAAVGFKESRKDTIDGIEHVFAINTLAPYVLTALIHRPGRLIYLSSGLHQSGNPDLGDLNWQRRQWNGMQAYSDTKLHDVLLAFAIARRWAGVYSNALEPGWVATKMGGSGAPDDLAKGSETQAWLAVSEDKAAKVTGRYFFHLKERAVSPAARDSARQDELLRSCEQMSGVTLPG
jgi:NAD(P)-dependent dehydrogenase (short-subunit alcohol dehydrogenase family)